MRMNIQKLFIATLLVCCSLSLWSANFEVHFPEFPIGVYAAIATDSDFEVLKKSGVNYVHSYSFEADKQQKLLDLAQRHGMKVMLNFDRRLLSHANGLEKMRQMVKQFKNHPALGFWYLCDEPSVRNGMPPEKLKPFYQLLKSETPQVPVAVCCCWDETFDQYSEVLDIQMADLYPVRYQTYPEAPLHEFSNFVAATKKLGKPVIGIPQLMHWQSFAYQLKLGKKLEARYRFPNFTELRYFYFSSLAQGVKGLIGFSYARAVSVDGGKKWWDEVAHRVLLETRTFADLMIAPDQPLIFKRAADSNRMAASWRGKDGQNYIMLVNSFPLKYLNPACYLEDKFPGQYRLIPWGNSRQLEAEINHHQLKVKGELQPWEVVIWKMESLNH